MDFIHWFVDIALHFQEHLGELALQHGGWIYGILSLIVFCETGLVMMPFLPGDSLLFVAGTLAAEGIGCLSFCNLFFSLSVAAIVGDTCNYFIGKLLGEKLFRHSKARLFKQSYLQKTHNFYEKYGGKAIILARFVPIVRTFAPFVAGMGRMRYFRFLAYNIFGGIIWIAIFLSAGYFLGHLPLIKNHLGGWLFLTVFISLLLGITGIWDRKK